MTAAPARSAVFLDKDGTLLDDVPFNVDPARMRLAPGAAEALSILGALDNTPLIVVSNQAGIAHGRFSEAAMQTVAHALEELFAAHGARLTAYYYCPHHPEGTDRRYARVCECRKPLPGMLERAAAEHGVDLRYAWMVGDILDDVEAGRRAGCTTVLVHNGNETEWQLTPLRRPHYSVTRLDHAARLISAWQRSGAAVEERAG
ncbi:MAG: histidinol-phosphate phosphatase family protein [Betaproteobacteria bacterium]|nr:histidinol-phosphate phosphatase family protein [Betaproteobacteria bacterium]